MWRTIKAVLAFKRNSRARWFKIFWVAQLALVAGVAARPAADEISYTSQPDEIVVFMNNIAFARDSITLPGGVEVVVVLPGQIYQDTLVLRENGDRVSNYRISHADAQTTVRWQSASDDDLRQVKLEYLVSGISWRPKYDMWLDRETATADPDFPGTRDDAEETIDFCFFAEIQNGVLSLEDVDVKLVAGRVDTSRQVDSVSMVTTNQIIVGYEDAGALDSPVGVASIHYVYEVSDVSADPGDKVYTSLEEAPLPARRVLFWNAPTDDQVTVIYKMRNESDLPFAEGIVRAYQEDLFLGSDFIELTPIGSEGSITVGNLQDVRVNREETRTAIDWAWEQDTQHDVELKLTNFSNETIEIDVVDHYPADGVDFSFSMDPQRQAGNLFRWQVEMQPGETVTISYQFKS